MRKILKLSLVSLLLIFIFRLLFCDFIIYTKTFGYEYRKHPIVWLYPRGILSPVTKYKVYKLLDQFIKKNNIYISRASENDNLDFDKFEILSIITKENGEKEVLVDLGEYVVFYIDGKKIKVD